MIKEKPRIIKIIKKKTVVIECVVVSKFPPKATWFKEKDEVKETGRHRVDIEQVKEGEYTVKLEINQVSEDDKGSYQLVARNEKGEAVSQIVELTDIPAGDEDEKPPKPVIVKKLRNETIEETRTLELNVQLKQTDRKSKVTWYRDSTVIKESTTIKQTFDGKSATLRVSKTKASVDSGTYRCVIKNEAGEDESSASITVKKVADKKKKKEEEEVEETVKVDEEADDEPQEIVGPFNVILRKTKQKKSVIEVKSIHTGILCLCRFLSVSTHVPFSPPCSFSIRHFSKALYVYPRICADYVFSVTFHYGLVLL